jgi:hypothetical protein
MSRCIPPETFCASPPDYEGIHLDAFFFVRTVVGLPPRAALLSDEDDYLGFSLLEVTTIC